MRKRIIVSVISFASVLALAGVSVFSLTRVGQAQGQRGQQAPPVREGQRVQRGGGGGGAESDAPSVPAPPGWKACPRCQNNADRRAANSQYKVDGHAFDPHDFTG